MQTIGDVRRPTGDHDGSCRGGAVELRTTSLVGNVTRRGGSRRWSGCSIRVINKRTASKPSVWIGWSTVVSGGSRERRLGNVVEPDHRQVAGHVDAELDGGAHGLDR